MAQPDTPHLAVQQMAIDTGIYAALEGTIDIHIHGNPDFCPRLLDDVDVVRLAKAAKMRAVMLKSHAGPTADRAYIAYEGHQIDCANLLAADLGVKPVFVSTEWKTLISGLAADQYDIVMTGTSMSAARAIVATFVDPWGRNAFIPLVQKKDATRFHTWSDLDQSSVTIGVNLGTTMEQFVQQNLSKATLRRVESPARDWQELLNGGVDATMSSLIEAAALTKEYPQLVELFVDQPRNPIPMAFLIPQGDPIWLAFLNNWTTLRLASGQFDTLAKKWGLAVA